MLAIHRRVLQQLAGGNHRLKLSGTVKVIVPAVYLVGTRRSVGRSDDKMERKSAFLKALHHCVLAYAGWTRDYHEQWHSLPLIEYCYVVLFGHLCYLACPKT